MLYLFGPTAVGKTSLSIELAKQINGEIISADSMQVYRGMDIGTAKPTAEERQGVPHHLIDIRDPGDEWTVSDFVGECSRISAEVKRKGKTPIIVGGTGLYLWSLIEGFAFPITPSDKELRARLETIPTTTLYSQLSTIDPVAAAKIHLNDKKRLTRALEVFELTGQPISELQKLRIEEPQRSVTVSKYNLFCLTLPREQLYERINQRVDRMIACGLIAEVKSLLAKGYKRELPALQGLGYKEVIDYLNGGYPTEAAMIEELKKRTRNFARRQLTWFRRFKGTIWLDAQDQSAALKAISNNLSENR
ncbi:MAG: tRNA (adenosine(37)-N6)-dimethylallyltransferase MiaA [Candidatus Margulisbacteria bacterium]|nr:tRNA (adenosine(37)-N6)-dimethylallyltransferase MiaA [Candidatus Margulisiibacteriota bacterium]MBU1617636.1 tRNA (adenosine(37)-N6)-dimethylallyltransferase MiaA [Candidatus Margulisiibacteriota bacterium]MBU1866929.1 tRNA (adenosine(37)-N6)-dimethylallyltransferase MiaA [Candidatus Margulisiibacteriota bacterium]